MLDYIVLYRHEPHKMRHTAHQDSYDTSPSAVIYLAFATKHHCNAIIDARGCLTSLIFIFASLPFD